MQETREAWGSRFGFVVATAGFAIGLGAIWRFPYQVGMNGGSAYVIVYLALSILVGLPLFIAEISLGRKARSNPIDGMRKLTRKGSPWVSFGWLGIGAALLIMAYYSVLITLLISYSFKIAAGHFDGASVAEIATIYETHTQNMPLMFIVNALLLAALCFIITKGLKGGVEKCCKVLMPLLFVLLIFVAIRSCTLEGASVGLEWYLKPDFSKITVKTVLDALPQVFFATSVAMAGTFVYGSYLDPKKSNIPGDALLIIALNTIIAVVAGLTIFPALFSFGMSPDMGPSLIFKTMPKLFSEMAGGRIFGSMFFLLIIAASVTTSIAFVEAVTATAADMLHISRKKAAVLTVVVMYLLSVPVMMSYGPWKNITVFGKNFFELADYISGNIFLPWAGLILVLFVIFKWKFANYMAESNVGTNRIKVEKWWSPVVQVFVPLVVAFVAVASLFNF